MEKLRLEREQNQDTLKNDKEKIIGDILRTDKNSMVTKHTEKKYSIWERIMKTLGMS